MCPFWSPFSGTKQDRFSERPNWNIIVADTVVHAIALSLAWLDACFMRIQNVYGQWSSAALSARSVFGWLAGRVHNLVQLGHALIFYCCCFAGFSNFFGLHMWSECRRCRGLACGFEITESNVIHGDGFRSLACSTCTKLELGSS